MVKVLLIIPYKGVKEQFEKKIQSVQERDIQIDTIHITGTSAELIAGHGYDIIIARGITFRALQEELPRTHMIEISMTGYDVVNAIANCRERFGPKRIAVLAHDPALANIERVTELCGTPIETYDVLNEKAIDSAIAAAVSHGADAFIGGLTMCHRCDALGLNRIHIKTGNAAIERAITEAVNAARTLNLERAKTRLMQSVLNSSRDVLIAVNKEGIVTAINNQAYMVYKLSLSEDMVGHSIEEFSHDTDWQKTLETGMEQEAVHQHYGKPYLINCKPILVDGQGAGVLITIQNAEKISETETKIRKELSKKGLVAKYHFGNIIGFSEAMRANIATAYKYSQVDSNVMLLGETGTGKELFAHSIHNASRRSNQPFVAVNCAALPENLLESELFGYVEGAFSGAVKGGKTGLFELAHKGSIFLDEIGEMPIMLQAKLLRVLQEKEIRRLGDDRVIPVDVRVISATNINIQEKIAAGQFRADLYYRLNLLNIKIQPLRTRKEDIPEMVSYFVSKFACDYAKPAPTLLSDAVAMLARYSWPGNARELRNFCERLVVLNESGFIGCDDIDRMLLSFHEGETDARPSAPAAECEEDELLKLLTQKRVRKEDLAKMLGVSRTTLWRRMNKLEKSE